jgi:K+-sensing histidine kinase KdpD
MSQQRRFEHFCSATASSTSENHSGGLGMSIAQAIVRAPVGVIECESSPGTGSLFTVILPVTPAEGIVLDTASKQKLVLS